MYAEKYFHSDRLCTAIAAFAFSLIMASPMLAQSETTLKPSAQGISSPTTVSLTQLSHTIPLKAQREFEKGQKAGLKGDNDRWVEHLKKALEIDPAYLEAYNNLGVAYMRKGQNEEALNQFDKADELDHNQSAVSDNRATVLLLLRRYPEAEKVAPPPVRVATSRPGVFPSRTCPVRAEPG